MNTAGKTLFVALLILAIIGAVASPVHAQSQSLTIKGWTMTVSWTGTDQPAGSATTVTILIHVLQTVYNLQVSVTGQGLSVSNDQGSGGSYGWDQLNQGDVRQIQFVVSTPSQAQVGNQYNATVGAQSYSTPAGPFGWRAPWDSPSSSAATSFLLHVVPVPTLGEQGGGGPDWGLLAVAAAVGFVLVVVVVAALSRY